MCGVVVVVWCCLLWVVGCRVLCVGCCVGGDCLLLMCVVCCLAVGVWCVLCVV